MLKSLDRIREQAQAIGENKFIINPHIPSTVELKQVVLQMNKMVEPVQNNYARSIETIKEAKLLRFKDMVSGLYNKAYFVRMMQANLESQAAVSKGEVILLTIEGLPQLKEVEGYGVSEAFIKEAAGILKDKTQKIEGRVVTCIKETEFGLILPCILPENAMDMAESILKDLLKLIKKGTVLEDYLQVYASVASYTYEDNTSTIFSKLDYSMILAKNSQDNTPVHFKEKTDTLLGRGEWKTLIETAIDSNNIVFSCQPVLTLEEQTFYREIFIAMKDDHGIVKSAGFFMPMAMELGLARTIDQHVMTQVARLIGEKKQKPVEDAFGVNVSADFIQDRNSFIWARNFLSAQKSLSAHLAFEMSEAVLIRYPEISLDFAGLVRGMGFSFGIDNFTINDDSLAMLQQLTPDYIKVDYAYLYDYRDQAKFKITLTMLQSITESLNIKLIGTKIETSNQLDDLKAAGIQYFQGRQVAQIQPLERHDG
ncbi:MAG: GGDEF domain-containing protein [Desulfobacter sp.]|nr:GGDEF domain-containing protein [Desulfobacter sp.]